jgi:phosphoglycolate phosphatase
MKLVITDLDNTLYDWVTYFAKSFTAMVDKLVDLLEIDRDIILDQFANVHRAYNNSEQPFAILELPVVQKRFAGQNSITILESLEPALYAFNEARDKNLRLYPGVISTLQSIRKLGVPIVGHTESVAVNAYYRLRKLRIWKYLDRLYALEGKLPPHPISGKEKEHAPPKQYVEKLPGSKRKPNPELLLDICARQGVNPEDALYVGDSLTRDVSMAKQAGVLAVWAQYGTEYNRDLWLVLVRITHWSDEDVAREARLKELYHHVKPDISIRSYDEILKIIQVSPRSLKDNLTNVSA